MEILKNIDRQILFAFHENTQNALFDAIMPIITHIGNLGAIWIVIGVILLFNKRYRYVGFFTLCSLFMCAVLGEFALKNIIQRPRPFIDMDTINLLIKAPTSYSFPSGHTTASFAAAGVLVPKLKNYRLPIIVLVILITFSRLYLLFHFPLDIVRGLLLGLLCGKITLYFRKGNW